MNLYFDLDNGVFTSSPGARDTVSTLSFKRGDTVSLAVRFISGIVVQELGSGAAGKLGLKESGEYDADFVASDTAWTKTGTGTSTVYTFELNLNTSELNTLLGHDGTEGNDIASVDLMMEMEWTVGGVTTSSNTITATVHNDVVKGTESGPTFSSEDTPPSNAASVEITGTLTSDGSTPVTFSTLLYSGVSNGKAAYTSTGDIGDISLEDSLWWNGTSWVLYSVDGASWTATDDVVTPDLVETWTPESLAAGTPVVTLLGATPGVLGSMKVDADFLYVVCEVTGDTPTWKKISLTAL